MPAVGAILGEIIQPTDPAGWLQREVGIAGGLAKYFPTPTFGWSTDKIGAEYDVEKARVDRVLAAYNTAATAKLDTATPLNIWTWAKELNASYTGEYGGLFHVGYMRLNGVDRSASDAAYRSDYPAWGQAGLAWWRAMYDKVGSMIGLTANQIQDAAATGANVAIANLANVTVDLVNVAVAGANMNVIATSVIGGLADAIGAATLPAASVGAAEVGAIVGGEIAVSAATDAAGGTIVAGAIAALSTALPVGMALAIKDGITGVITAVAAGTIINTLNLGGVVLDGMLSPVISAFEATAPTSPVIASQTTDGIKTILSGAMNALIGQVITAELLSPLKAIGLGYVSAMLFDASGFRIIIGAIVEAHVKRALEIPLGYYLNEKYRPKVLDLREASHAWREGFINDEDFSRHAAWAGYPDGYLAFFKNEAYSALASRFMVRLVDAGFYDDELFTEELRHAGLRPAAVEKMRAYLAKAATDAQTKGGLALIRRSYKQGMLKPEEYRDNLITFGVPEKVADLEVAVVDMELAQDSRELSASSILALYRERVIDDTEAMRRLAALGYPESASRELVELEDIKRSTSPRRISQAQAEAAYKLDVISDEAYWYILIDLNYSETDAGIIYETSLREKAAKAKVK